MAKNQIEDFTICLDSDNEIYIHFICDQFYFQTSEHTVTANNLFKISRLLADYEIEHAKIVDIICLDVDADLCNHGNMC